MIKYLKEKPKPLSYINYLIVDEYQDVNKAQQELVALIARNASVYIVGDLDNVFISGVVQIIVVLIILYP